MKGDFLRNVLEFIQETYNLGEDLAYIGANAHRLYPREQFISKARAQREFQRSQHRQLQQLLSKLKRQGIIASTLHDDHVMCRLTKRGIAKLAKLKQLLQRKPLPSSLYTKEVSLTFTIVTFDIPERERYKRDWLRSVLQNLSFTMLQKSVWIGKIKIPEQFLADLHKLQLSSFVEILQITKSGTLRNVV